MASVWAALRSAILASDCAALVAALADPAAPTHAAAADPSGRTLWHYAAMAGSVPVAEALLAHFGAAVDAALLATPDTRGCTPLHAATVLGHFGFAAWLEQAQQRLSGATDAAVLSEQYRRADAAEQRLHQAARLRLQQASSLIDVFARRSEFVPLPASAVAADPHCTVLVRAAPQAASADRSFSVVGRQEFQERFAAFSNHRLEGLDWSNVVAIGGGIVCCLLPETAANSRRSMPQAFLEGPFSESDIDLYIYDVSQEAFEAKLSHILATIQRNVGAENVMVVRTPHTITYVSGYPMRHIQVVTGQWESVEHIVCGTDIDCTCVAYDGNTVWTLPRGKLAFNARMSFVSVPTRYSIRGSPGYEKRLLKYAERGFAVADFGLVRQLALLPRLPRRERVLEMLAASTAHDAVGVQYVLAAAAMPQPPSKKVNPTETRGAMLPFAPGVKLADIQAGFRAKQRAAILGELPRSLADHYLSYEVIRGSTINATLTNIDDDREATPDWYAGLKQLDKQLGAEEQLRLAQEQEFQRQLQALAAQELSRAARKKAEEELMRAHTLALAAADEQLWVDVGRADADAEDIDSAAAAKPPSGRRHLRRYLAAGSAYRGAAGLESASGTQSDSSDGDWVKIEPDNRTIEATVQAPPKRAPARAVKGPVHLGRPHRGRRHAHRACEACRALVGEITISESEPLSFSARYNIAYINAAVSRACQRRHPSGCDDTYKPSAVPKRTARQMKLAVSRSLIRKHAEIAKQQTGRALQAQIHSRPMNYKHRRGEERDRSIRYERQRRAIALVRQEQRRCLAAVLGQRIEDIGISVAA